ncbi:MULTISPECIES: lipopolysaccharide biosynthesis protein [Methylobacterium]|uniref:O-antigen/teichoic acid export membrane protein n=2 Tax=Methylobacterium TaxID=407 RepID=A0ABR6DKB4_9HYPH|nr:lipopolysaccharide biosynthesis protein [Methylobacterium sp.]MBA9065754.1 O-antigen/teichoic acid export membrane protein [Methylobacterium fujisawaense]MBP28984.1 polysaccharide biosynthesis protein [Methylobacterium sp.]
MSATALPLRAFRHLRALKTGPQRAALTVFAIRVGAAGFAYGAQVLAARMMGWDAYGIFASVWVWTAMLGHTLTLGLSQGACRFVPGDQAQGDLDLARGYIRAGALVTGGAALAIAGLGAALLMLEPDLFAPAYWAPIAVALGVMPLFALQDYLEGVARSQNWVGLAIAPPYLLRQTLMMGCMIAAILLGAPPRAEVAMACMLIAAAGATGLQAALLAARLRRSLPAGPHRYRWRAWLGTSLPIAAIDLANAGFTFVDVIVLGALVSPAEVGVYFAATRIQQFVVFVHYAVSAATLQRYSAAQAQANRFLLAELVRRQGRMTAAATLVVGGAILAVSPLLLAMFGPGLGASVPILCILIAGSVGASLFGPGEDLLTMLGGERLCAGITVGSLVAAAGLCLALVPAFGTLGAAMAVALATMGRAALLARAAGRIHGLPTPVWAAGMAR